MDSPLSRDHVALEHFALLSGEELHFVRSGVPGAQTVLLLHGLSQQSHYWNPTISKLLSDRPALDIIALDQRGHGDSNVFTPQSDFSMDRLALDARELLDFLGVEKAIVVGHSWGASVALRFGALFPEYTLAALLIDGGAFNPTDMIPAIYPGLKELRVALRPPVGPFQQGDLIDYYTPMSQPEEISNTLSAIARTYREIAQGQYVTTIGIDRHMAVAEGLLEYSPAEDLNKIVVPLTVIRCEESQGARGWGLPLTQENANIRVCYWYGCCHDVPLQRPAMVAELISNVIGIELGDDFD